MVALALVLLILVAVFSVAIVLSNPDVYELSLFRVLVPVTSAGVFFTGFGAALVTVAALLLLRTGLRRGREHRQRLRTAEQAALNSAAAQTAPASDAEPDRPTDDQTADTDREASSTLDLVEDERPPSTGSDEYPAERHRAVSSADERDDPRL